MLARAVHETALSLWCALPPVIAAQNDIRAQQVSQKTEFEASVAAATAEGNPAPAAPVPIPFLTDEECLKLDVSEEDIRSVFAHLHRASFSNALIEDSEAAAKEVYINQRTFAEFRRLIRHYLLKEWADPRCLATTAVTDRPMTVATNASSSRPGTSHENALQQQTGGTSSATASSGPQTLVEAYLYDMVQCVVDDREPSALLPLPSVWIRVHFPLTVAQPFKKFAKVEVHPTHDAVFDLIFNEMLASTGGEAKTATEAAFATYFTICYKHLFRNAAPERCTVAAKDVWYRVVSRTDNGSMDLAAFIRASDLLAQMYAKRKDVVAFLKEIVAVCGVSTASSQPSAGWLATAVEKVKPCPSSQLLQDPENLYVHDELCDEIFNKALYSSVTANRVLITGPEGSGKSGVAAAIAKKLNIVNLDVEALAIQAADDASNSLGPLVLRSVQDKAPLPLYVQAELIRRALEADATRHLGFVCGDVPCVSKTFEELYLSQLGFDVTLPQVVVKVVCPLGMQAARAAAAQHSDALLYAEELLTREAEQAEVDAVAAKHKEKLARDERNSELRAKKAAVEANADATAEEQEIFNVAEEEEPEEPPAFDDDGNELGHEEIEERSAIKQKAVDRRRFLSELHQQIIAGRQAVQANNGSAEPDLDPLETKTLALCKEIATARNQIINIGCVDTPENYADFISKRLRLVASVAPTRPQLSDEALENLGPDTNTNDYLEALGAALDAHVEEFPNQYPVSDWQKNCPVTYKEDGVLVEGASDFMLEYRGFIYYFASGPKAQRFKDSPHRYLANKPLLDAPVLLLKSKIDAFTIGPDPKKELIKERITPVYPNAAAVRNGLAEGLQLTVTTLTEYAEQRKAQLEQIKVRTEQFLQRAKADMKQRKEAEDRIKKRAEAEAQRRKKEERASKTKKAPTKKGAAAAAANAAEAVESPTIQMEAVEEAEEEAVATTASRIQIIIDQKKRIAEQAYIPQIISVLDEMDAALLLELYEARNLPQNIVVVDKKAPPPVPAEDADDEEEYVDSDEELDNVEEEEDTYDEEGNVIPRETKKEDLTDLKQYRRFIRSFVEKLEASTEQADEDGGISNQTSTAVTPVPATVDDAPTPVGKPFQAFTITRTNAYNKSSKEIVDEVVLKVIPSALKPAQSEEELIEDNDEDVENMPSNPLLIPGTRAIHQFGAFRRFCPVSLVEEDTFITGSTEFVASYRYNRYLFASEEKMNKFILNPHKYLTTVTPPPCPPARLWVLGPKISGKKTISNVISQKFNIPFFDAFDVTYFEELIAAATHEPIGGVVRGLKIPYQSNAALADALTIQASLKAFADKQVELTKLKEETLKAQELREKEIEEGEEVDDLDEAEEEAIQKAVEFEPEEEEVKTERLAVAHRKLGAALMKIEPFSSRGYMLLGRPSSEAELEGILAAGAYPDAVLSVKLSADTYVNRLVGSIVKERTAALEATIRDLKKRRDDQMIAAREREITKWRRRNIGEDDEPTQEEEEETIDEDPEPVSEEAIRAELEQQLETELSAVAALTEMLPERRVPLVSVNGNSGKDACISAVLHDLHVFLADRQSILEAPTVLKFKDAKSMLSLGQKNISSFFESDPVELFHSRYDPPGHTIDRFSTKPAKDLTQYASEPEVLPASNEPKAKKTKMVPKIVVVQNEDGEDEEVEEMEEVEDEEEPEDAPADEEEAKDEEELDLEPEPEHDPEELAEMAKEQAEKEEKFRERSYPKSASFRNRVYFFKSEVNLLEFVQSPFKFWNQPPPLFAVPSVTVVVEDLKSYAQKQVDDGEANAGDLKAVTRPLAYHLAKSAGAVFITIPKLLTWALTHHSSFPDPLGQQLLDSMIRGVPLESAFVSTLLAARLTAADALGEAGAIVSDVLREPAEYYRLLVEGGGAIEVTAALSLTQHQDPVTLTVQQRAQVTQHIPTTEPTSAASLVEAYTKIKQARKAEQLLLLRRTLGFPAPIRHAMLTEDVIVANATQAYTFYCPYMWSRKRELVEVGKDRRFTALYLGQFYCFSQQPFLEEFLTYPDRFDKATRELVLPKTLPKRLSAAEASNEGLQYCGCCPVTLYDTRDNTGLCGVAEPTAVLGTLFVEYDNKIYAVSSEEFMERFLRQPWIYVENPVLPPANKLPQVAMITRHTPSNEKYVTLTLHDPIAKAMLEVANVRPKYPSMSADESARKFIALYLRAHNPTNGEAAAKQHRDNYEDFKTKATLYKTITSTEPNSTADEERFAMWDAVQEDPTDYKKYADLRETHADPQPTMAAANRSVNGRR